MNGKNTFHKNYLGPSETDSAITLDLLRNADSFGSFIVNAEESFFDPSLAKYLNKLLSEKKLTKASVIKASGLDEAYGYEIFNGKKRPSRDKLILLTFGMHMTEKEAQRTLKLGKCGELYVKIPRDAAILYAIQRNMTIEAAEDLLYHQGFESLYGKDA